MLRKSIPRRILFTRNVKEFLGFSMSRGIPGHVFDCLIVLIDLFQRLPNDFAPIALRELLEQGAIETSGGAIVIRSRLLRALSVEAGSAAAGCPS